MLTNWRDICTSFIGEGSPKSLLSLCSVAVLFLREISMPCTEQQMEALTSCLSRPEAFGPFSAWGPEIFTEIGTLAGTAAHNIPVDLNFIVIQLFSLFFQRVRTVKERNDRSWMDRCN